MASKKRKPDGDRSKRRKSTRPAELPDRRAMEGVMQQFAAGLQGHASEDTPLGKAQALMYRAFEDRDEKRGPSWPGKPSKSAPTAPMPTSCWPKTPPAARRPCFSMNKAWPPANGRSGQTHFSKRSATFGASSKPDRTCVPGWAWPTLSGPPAGVRKPYSICKTCCASTPATTRASATPWQASCSSSTGTTTWPSSLSSMPTEGSAAWAYTRALLAFRQHGDTVAARQLLKQARKTNKHVPAYLAGRKVPAASGPATTAPATKAKPSITSAAFMAAWRSTPGAVAWVRENVKAKEGIRNASGQGPAGLHQEMAAQEPAARTRRLAGRLPPAAELDQDRRHAHAPVGHSRNQHEQPSDPGQSDAG